MTTGWTVVLLAVGLVLGWVYASWRRRGNTAELGAVSARWIAEHNATESQYTGR